MRTILLATATTLMAAGGAFADQIRVVIPPTADTPVNVVHVNFVPGTGAPLGDLDGDFQGVSTADRVEFAGEATDFGFEPDAVIYIYKNEDGSVRVARQ